MLTALPLCINDIETKEVNLTFLMWSSLRYCIVIILYNIIYCVISTFCVWLAHSTKITKESYCKMSIVISSERYNTRSPSIYWYDKTLITVSLGTVIRFPNIMYWSLNTSIVSFEMRCKSTIEPDDWWII